MRNNLICTVGTSLLTNLDRAQNDPRAPLVSAWQARDARALAGALRQAGAEDRLCGAEVNSIAGLVAKKFVAPDCKLHFLHSDTDEGRFIAAVLEHYYKDTHTVQILPVPDLQDADPRRFASVGLRNLARCVCRTAREYGAANCAINATGGYKAQIALATLLGQAIGIPVYYKHEKFDQIVAFPPMPVALDFELWMRKSGTLFLLDRNDTVKATPDMLENWDETDDNLFERETVDGQNYVALSPVGQIFHETFRERFRTNRDQVLPPAVRGSEKRPPKWEDSGHMRANPEVMEFMQETTRQPWVTGCATWYFNPGLPGTTRFRLGAKGIEGVFSNGTWCAKFRVDTSAKTEGQKNAVVAALNDWVNGAA